MKKLCTLILSATLIVSAVSANAAEAIGKITNLEGTIVKIENGESTALKTDADVFLNDTIQTEVGSFADITFVDETTISLGAATTLEINKYVYDPEDQTHNSADFSLTKGAFHYVSGLIAKKENPDVTIKLDFGSIGIRGTQIWRDMTTEPDGSISCRVYIEDGKAVVYNNYGRVTLNNGEGTKIKGIQSPPTTGKAWESTLVQEIKSKVKN